MWQPYIESAITLFDSVTKSLHKMCVIIFTEKYMRENEYSVQFEQKKLAQHFSLFFPSDNDGSFSCLYL